ncbi:unnamed protein product, partial [Soboliphyme baturini]|uniref:ZP domain-containing protein n=1 Tax=Soboliphyme baturini TaxID=241478 RepID=A0A183J5Y5_9BILA
RHARSSNIVRPSPITTCGNREYHCANIIPVDAAFSSAPFGQRIIGRFFFTPTFICTKISGGRKNSNLQRVIRCRLADDGSATVNRPNGRPPAAGHRTGQFKTQEVPAKKDNKCVITSEHDKPVSFFGVWH